MDIFSDVSIFTLAAVALMVMLACTAATLIDTSAASWTALRACCSITRKLILHCTWPSRTISPTCPLACTAANLMGTFADESTTHAMARALIGVHCMRLSWSISPTSPILARTVVALMDNLVDESTM
jgi:hypothetical protein